MKKKRSSQVLKQLLVRCFSCWVGGFLTYFCGFLTIPISNVLLERKGVGLFVIYHSYVIFIVETGADNSELIPKRFSV